MCVCLEGGGIYQCIINMFNFGVCLLESHHTGTDQRETHHPARKSYLHLSHLLLLLQTCLFERSWPQSSLNMPTINIAAGHRTV
jgi:hypothetical protein